MLAVLRATSVTLAVHRARVGGLNSCQLSTVKQYLGRSGCISTSAAGSSVCLNDVEPAGMSCAGCEQVLVLGTASSDLHALCAAASAGAVLRRPGAGRDEGRFLAGGRACACLHQGPDARRRPGCAVCAILKVLCALYRA